MTFSALVYIFKIIPLKYDFSRLLGIWDLLKFYALANASFALFGSWTCFSAFAVFSLLEQCSARFGKWLMPFLMKTSWLRTLASSNTVSLAVWAKGA